MPADLRRRLVTDSPWQRWFAVHPVWIDAYDISEMKNGKTRYRVWLRWVRRCWVTIPENYITSQDAWSGWKYRL